VLAEPRDVDAVHLTLLGLDGHKADVERPKLFVGSPAGRPIVLAPPNDLLVMAITEGIEDALSAHQALGIGAWAAGSASFLPALADVVPDYIDAITILAHEDLDGQRYAAELRRRLHVRAVEASVVTFNGGA
jgi:hypothetical protein